MGLIHHIVSGDGDPPIVFIHGFGCASSDWDAQVAYFSPWHRTIAVDLRGHGNSPGVAAECSIERYGADVAEVMRTLALPPALVVGHSMGCRVAVEAALQAPSQTAGVVLVDGSQFAPEMEGVLRQRFAQSDGYMTTIRSLFREMFSDRIDKTVIAAVTERAGRLPRDVGEKMLTDMQRYDVARLMHSLASLRVPVLVVQCTYSNEKRERRMLLAGQSSPYLEMVRAQVPSARIKVIAETGHFPQLEAAEETNALIEAFIAECYHSGHSGEAR